MRPSPFYNAGRFQWCGSGINRSIVMIPELKRLLGRRAIWTKNHSLPCGAKQHQWLQF